MAILTLLFNEKKIKDFELASGGCLTIGRIQDNDIVIDNPAVSSHHARIESVASSFVIRDLNSTNGLFVNKKQVETHSLHHDDVIRIGKHDLVFDVFDNMNSKNGKRADKSQDEDDAYADDKTRFLITSEHRELIEKAKKQSNREND